MRDIIYLVVLFVVLATFIFFVNGWLFMLAVGNLGLSMGFKDSALTAGLLGACFAGAGVSIKASTS